MARSGERPGTRLDGDVGGRGWASTTTTTTGHLEKGGTNKASKVFSLPLQPNPQYYYTYRCHYI